MLFAVVVVHIVFVMVVVVIVVVLLLLLMLSPLLRSSSFNHLIDAFYAFINNNVNICIDQYCSVSRSFHQFYAVCALMLLVVAAVVTLFDFIKYFFLSYSACLFSLSLTVSISVYVCFFPLPPLPPTGPLLSLSVSVSPPESKLKKLA